MKFKCPICNGSGKIKAPLKGAHKNVIDKGIMVRKLRSDGYSIREIAELMGYKSTSPVHRWIKKGYIKE